MNRWYGEMEKELEDLREKGQFRFLRNIEGKVGKSIRAEGKDYLNFSSNDYLGIASNKELHKEFYENLREGNILDNYGLSSASSRLLTGNSFHYGLLEKELASFFRREAALVFNSGYHANTGILPALLGPDDAVFSDKLNHASIIDGMLLSRAAYHRYRHNDMGHLSDLLEKNRARYKRAVIVTESIFSMDGDRCELQELVRLKNRYEALLYIDEAHGVGALGKKGKGLAEEKNLIGDIDILMGTFGKALGGLGAYAVFDGVLKDYLINKMRPFIFTTGLPPVQLHWNRFVLKKIHAMQKQRAHLHDLSRKLRALIREKGFETRGDTHIVPLIVGKNDETGKWADAFQKAGILVFGIRPPTVPAGTSRLRFSLTANLGEEDLSKIETVLKGNRS